ncbi:MAG TPA: hypothetical protein VGG64_15060, partial [Pirellulales bacterium]
ATLSRFAIARSPSAAKHRWKPVGRTFLSKVAGFHPPITGWSCAPTDNWWNASLPGGGKVALRALNARTFLAGAQVHGVGVLDS